jgi:hypothetical protein
MLDEIVAKRSLAQTKLARGASEVWRGVWDDFRNWLQLGPEAREKT